jgi:uncharacterized membrane protein YkvI
MSLNLFFSSINILHYCIIVCCLILSKIGAVNKTQSVRFILVLLLPKVLPQARRVTCSLLLLKLGAVFFWGGGGAIFDESI